MKILITGTAGRVGRAIYISLMKNHDVTGFDRTPCSTADVIGDIRDKNLIDELTKGKDVIVHTAAFHAPHVDLYSEEEFNQINVQATENLAKLAFKNGAKHFVFTSTTALYGHASTPANKAGWITESTSPQPKTIYHRSKIAAEKILQDMSDKFNKAVTVLQMSRCFPEPADLMAVYRLTRGVDARDVASAHAKAIEKRWPGFHRYIISGTTLFTSENCKELFKSADKMLKKHCPELAEEFTKRGWNLPLSLDRVYDSSKAVKELDWHPQYGFKSVLQMLDQDSSEVLPVLSSRKIS